MSYYVMRNVRCKSCCKVIGHLAELYKALLDNGYTTDQAFDEIGLDRYCCRKEMFCPFRIRFSMENRQAIEGSITVGEIPIKMQAEMIPNHPLIKSPGKKFATESGKAQSSNEDGKNKQQKDFFKEPSKKNDTEEDFFEDIFEDEVEIEEEAKDMSFPTYLGIPTYNTCTFPPVYVRVGDGYEVKVIGGRTYLAN